MKEYKILRKSTYRQLENEINKLAKEGWIFKDIQYSGTVDLGSRDNRIVDSYYAVMERDTE